MVISKEILSDFKEIYEKANKLIIEEYKNDPDTDPFRSHYVARDMLLELMDNIKAAMNNEQSNPDDKLTLDVILAFVLRDIGRVLVFTEDRPGGEKHLQLCLSTIEPYKFQREAIIAYMGALNDLGIIYCDRQELQESLRTFQKVEDAYTTFKESKEEAMTLTDMFGPRDEAEKDAGTTELEALYTLCMFYLAQVYSHLGALAKSAEYCHGTMKRQIEAKSHDPVDFGLNAATLSQYFIGHNLFREARHHLSAATLIMDEYQMEMITPDMTEEQQAAVTETFKHRYADVARCWAKYGLALLSASKERLYRDEQLNIASDTGNMSISRDDSYTFPQLDVGHIEQQVSCDYCLVFDDAKLVYRFVIKNLDLAKAYYTMESEASEYAKIIEDYAELYQHMAFFEEDPENQFKMHKRRVTLYEDLLKALNPTYFMSICRECWYGAGLAYSAMLDIKLDLIKDMSASFPQGAHKINQICMKAIKHFQSYTDSYMDTDQTMLIGDLSSDEIVGIMYAFFYIGRLYYKMMSPDKAEIVENLKNCLKYYSKFLEECQKQSEATESLRSEIGLCKEMVLLLPLKIDSMAKELNTS